jgi:TPR repeat protein
MTRDEAYKKGMELFDAGNFQEAARYFQKLADTGSKEGQFQLGVLYLDGAGVPQDSKKALDLYRQSAEQGYDEAQYVLGLYYKDDLPPIVNASADLKKSAEWLRKAAEQNHSGGQFHLALAYRNGDGVPKDDKKSMELCHKAAAQGHDYAQFILGLYYSGGLKGMGNAHHDMAKAIGWLKKSAAQGNEEATAELAKLKQ